MGSAHADSEPEPALLVSMGSGISLIRVEPGSDGRLERVNGCSIGGGTYWGLVRLLTNFKTFDASIEGAERGNNDKVAMLVKDIYGGSYATLGLPGDIVACDFGKVAVSPLPHGGAWKHLPRREAGSDSESEFDS